MKEIHEVINVKKKTHKWLVTFQTSSEHRHPITIHFEHGVIARQLISLTYIPQALNAHFVHESCSQHEIFACIARCDTLNKCIEEIYRIDAKMKSK